MKGTGREIRKHSREEFEHDPFGNIRPRQDTEGARKTASERSGIGIEKEMIHRRGAVSERILVRSDFREAGRILKIHP